MILVGASIRAAAESAFRGGFDVLGIDQFGDRETIQACRRFWSLPSCENDTRNLMMALRKSASESRLPPATKTKLPKCIVVGGLNLGTGDRSGLIDQLDRWVPVVGAKPILVPASGLQEASQLAKIAANAGATFPAVCHDGVRLDEKPGRWLIKDLRSSGGLSVRWLTESAPFSTNGLSANGTIAQQWKAGRSYGATFVADGGRAELLGVCRSLFTRIDPYPFVYAGSFGPVDLTETQTCCIDRIGQAFVQETKAAGLFNVDVIIDGADVWLLEINRRWSGSSELIERSLQDQGSLGECGGSLFRLMIKRMQQCDQQKAIIAGRADDSEHQYYKRIVFARQAGHLKVDRILTVGAQSQGIEIKDTPNCEAQAIRKGEPIATLIVRADKSGAWTRKIKRLVAQVQQAVE